MSPSATDLRDQPPATPAPSPAPAAPASSPMPASQQQEPAVAKSPETTSPTVAARRFHLRPGPIFIVIVLGFGLPILPYLLIDFASDHLPIPWVHRSLLGFEYVQYGVQAVLALIGVWVARPSVPGEYGLRRPQGRTYIGAALFWGIAFGLAMTAVDFAPQLLTHTAPKFDGALTRSSIAGWLIFSGLYLGPTEEILYRSLLVGYLSAAMPGKVRFGRFEMNGAGVVVAVLFAFLNIGSFITANILIALGQVIYALAMGVFFAYWFEKSKSVLAPIVGHNVSYGIKAALMFAMILAWK